MTERSPSDTLLAAADRIRDLAAAATGGEWCYGRDQTVIATLPERLGVRRGLVVARKVDDVDRAWIAALSPALAPMIEKLLRDATGMWRLYEGRGWPEEKVRAHVDSVARSALALAEAILGSGVDTP